MSKRKKFIKLYRKAAMLYLRANSYAHKFFYSKGFRPYDEIHPIEFTIAPTAMVLDVNGTPKDVLNIVDGKVVIVNEFGDFTATLKATIPEATEYNIIEWSFQKELAGQLVDCDDTEVTFTPNPLDETECEFSIRTIQDEACRIVISASIKGDYGVIGNGIPVEIGFFDIPKLTIAPTALMFGGDDILDYDAETKTITVSDKLGVFTLDLEMTPLEGVDFDVLDWSYAKVAVGELANCDDTTVTFIKDSVEPLKKVAFTITTIANVACSVVIDATISKDSTIIETSHSIKIEFTETPAPPEPKLTIAPTALMFDGDDILDYDAETKTITVSDKLGVFTLDLEMTPLEGVDFDVLDWSYAKVAVGELANCDDTTVTFTKDSVEPLKKVAFTITTIANVACSVVIDATISKDSTIIETSHSIKIEFTETPAPPEPEPEP